MKIRRAVYTYRKGLRWYFKDTQEINKFYFISLNPKDFWYILEGHLVFILPPTRIEHIKGIWK